MGQAALLAEGLLCCLPWHCALGPHSGSVTRFKLVSEEQTTSPWNTQGFRTVVSDFIIHQNNLEGLLKHPISEVSSSVGFSMRSENLLFFFFLLFRNTPGAHGSSLARGRIGAPASGLCHCHSNMGSQPCLRPTLRLMAAPDP